MDDREHPAERGRVGPQLMRAFQRAHAGTLHEVFCVVLIAGDA
jgi:hypothetical protein